jgi:dUTP pyrophosphatase
MEKNEIKDYIEKLQQFEKGLSEENNEENFDLSMFSELDKLLSLLNEDTTKELYKDSNMLDVKIKKLHKDATIPTYSKDGDAGMDLTITELISDTTFNVTYGFGIAMEIPMGYVGLVFPRSSVRNMDLILSNSVGVIDSGYRGEIQATFKKTQSLSMGYKVGERGAQIIIIPYPKIKFTEVNELSSTDRGTGGFGSTGIK